MRTQEGPFSLGTLMAALLLLITGFVVCFYHLGKADFYRDAPARVAANVRQMNLEGVWIPPRAGDPGRVELPPAYPWAVRLASGLRGSVSAFQTRLPSAISGLLLLFLAALWFYGHAVRYTRDDGADAPAEGFSLLAGLMLAASPIFFICARAGTPEALFTLLWAAAAFCWTESLEARRSFYAGRPWRVWIFWGYGLAGLAILVHGLLILPMLWLPYLLAARSYRLRGPDWIHLAGLLLALCIGGAWYVFLARLDPHRAGDLARELLTLRLGREAMPRLGIGHYGLALLVGTFPWLLLALVMAVRVQRKLSRSPTLVMWLWSLVVNLVLLSVLAPHAGAFRLAPALLIVLLAASGLQRWNFENRWAVALRAGLRILIILLIAVGTFLALLLNSTEGLLFFIVIALGWLGWTIYSRRQGIIYSPWNATVRLAAMAVLILLAGETLHLTNWEPRKRYHVDTIAYFNRVQDALRGLRPKAFAVELGAAERKESKTRLFFWGDRTAGLHDFYLDGRATPAHDLAALYARAGESTYLFAEHDLARLLSEPRLVPTVTQPGRRPELPARVMFRVLPDDLAPSTFTLADRAAWQPPVNLAVLGNTGTRADDQEEVGDAVDAVNGRIALDSVLLLGNNIYGPNVFDHLDFIESFEEPYKRLLKRGVLFHALLGHEDQGYRWLQMKYPAFHMREPYYRLLFGGGMVEVWMLDSERLLPQEGGAGSSAQLRWLLETLAASHATWKVVALHEALMSASPKADVNEQLAAVLLPLFDEHQVDIVAWADGAWYERLRPAGHRPVFLNAGWSGDSDDANFVTDPSLIAANDRHPGFILLQFTPRVALITAITARGDTIDQGELSRAGAVSWLEPVPITKPEPEPVSLPVASDVAPGLSDAPTTGAMP